MGGVVGLGFRSGALLSRWNPTPSESFFLFISLRFASHILRRFRRVPCVRECRWRSSDGVPMPATPSFVRSAACYLVAVSTPRWGPAAAESPRHFLHLPSRPRLFPRRICSSKDGLIRLLYILFSVLCWLLHHLFAVLFSFFFFFMSNCSREYFFLSFMVYVAFKRFMMMIIKSISLFCMMQSDAKSRLRISANSLYYWV